MQLQITRCSASTIATSRVQHPWQPPTRLCHKRGLTASGTGWCRGSKPTPYAAAPAAAAAAAASRVPAGPPTHAQHFARPMTRQGAAHRHTTLAPSSAMPSPSTPPCSLQPCRQEETSGDKVLDILVLGPQVCAVTLVPPVGGRSTSGART